MSYRKVDLKQVKGHDGEAHLEDTLVAMKDDLSAEVTARTEAVNSEAAARISGDAAERAFALAARTANETARDNSVEAIRLALQTDIDQNESDIDAALAGEVARAQAKEGEIEQELESVETAASTDRALIRTERTNLLDALVDGADSGYDTLGGLQGKIETEESRIDDILNLSVQDKNSFHEIVQLIESVDATNDQAFAGYVLSNNAALAQEVSDRESADNDLQGAIDTEKARAEGVEAGLQTALDQEIADRTSAVTGEAALRVQGDTALTNALNSEIQNRTQAIGELQQESDHKFSLFEMESERLSKADWTMVGGEYMQSPEYTTPDDSEMGFMVLSINGVALIEVDEAAVSYTHLTMPTIYSV